MSDVSLQVLQITRDSQHCIRFPIMVYTKRAKNDLRGPQSRLDALFCYFGNYSRPHGDHTYLLAVVIDPKTDSMSVIFMLSACTAPRISSSDNSFAAQFLASDANDFILAKSCGIGAAADMTSSG